MHAAVKSASFVQRQVEGGRFGARTTHPKTYDAVRQWSERYSSQSKMNVALAPEDAAAFVKARSKREGRPDPSPTGMRVIGWLLHSAPCGMPGEPMILLTGKSLNL